MKRMKGSFCQIYTNITKQRKHQASARFNSVSSLAKTWHNAWHEASPRITWHNASSRTACGLQHWTAWSQPHRHQVRLEGGKELIGWSLLFASNFWRPHTEQTADNTIRNGQRAHLKLVWFQMFPIPFPTHQKNGKQRAPPAVTPFKSASLRFFGSPPPAALPWTNCSLTQGSPETTRTMPLCLSTHQGALAAYSRKWPRRRTLLPLVMCSLEFSDAQRKQSYRKPTLFRIIMYDPYKPMWHIIYMQYHTRVTRNKFIFTCRLHEWVLNHIIVSGKREVY